MADATSRMRVPRLKQWFVADCQQLLEERALIVRLEARIRSLFDLLANHEVEAAELETLVGEEVWDAVQLAVAGPGRPRERAPRNSESSAAPRLMGADTRSNPRRNEVLEAVVDATRRGAQHMTPGEVVMHLRARGLEANDRTIRRDLERLVAAGWLERPDRGVYRLGAGGVSTYLTPQ